MTETQDAFGTASDWQAVVSGEATLNLSAASKARAPAMRMDYRFTEGGGFVVARRAIHRDMPEDYALRFFLRGRGGPIQLEIKLVDATGLNVWRCVKRDFSLPARWTRVTVESRDIEFGWGPAGEGGIANLGSLEIALVASAADAGTVWFAGLEIEDCTPSRAAVLQASSEVTGFEASAAMSTGWKPQPGDAKAWIVIDFTAPRRLGGLVIDWLEGPPPRGFCVRVSATGRRWRTVYTAARAGGARSNVYLPNTQTRYLRLELNGAVGAVLRPQSFEFSRSIYAFWHNVASAQPRGWHPRWLHREQTLWTPIGTSHGTHCELMNEDGLVEVGRGSFSLEPMVWAGDRLYTWSDVISRPTLQRDWMPAPGVIWQTADWRLHIQGAASVSGRPRVRYRFENLTPTSLSARLFILLRPFQVTPPWQRFRNLGGISPLHRLDWREGSVYVDQATRVVPTVDADGFAALSFDDGFMAAHLAQGHLPAAARVDDPTGFATGALAFTLSVSPNDSAERALSVMPADAAAGAEEADFDWAALFEQPWSGSGWALDATRAALTAAAHILVTRDGPALQPGPRRYTRSWIRDGAMMCAALLRMGRAGEVRDFIRWYAPHQRADGFVPCCVDREGIDWLVEHDSHGELIAVTADYYRFTQDRGFIEEAWPFLEKAAECIERLLGPDGLLPISVSHEGYLAQPVHSFWDDFWALRGLRDAAELAAVLGRDTRVRRWTELARRFAAALFGAIDRTRLARRLDFIPGSIEWADFDPTATANALYLLDVPPELDRAALDRTFDKYLQDWRSKRSGALASSNYTPYEIRIIGALVRLGQRDAALELLRFFLADRRPQAWNQWPEIAWRDRKAPAHMGDLPHTWISAEYVLALRCLFAYEREADRAVVIAAGLAHEWIEGEGVRVNRMPTAYGALSYALRRIDAHTAQFDIEGTSSKLVLRPPLLAPLRSVTINGAPATFGPDQIEVLETPARVICSTA